MSLVLAADTTTAVNTVALCSEEGILAETTVDCHRAHSERLIATVEWVLSESGRTLKDVAALAISNGPGSFTGLRIGAATWKGFAAALGLPLVAVPTLDALSRVAMCHDGLVCVMLDARMKEVFGAWYQFDLGQRRKLTADLVCSVEDLLAACPREPDVPRFALGDGAVVYRERVAASMPDLVLAPFYANVPRASAVAAEAFALMRDGAVTDAHLAAPVYLRKSQAEINRERQVGT